MWKLYAKTLYQWIFSLINLNLVWLVVASLCFTSLNATPVALNAAEKMFSVSVSGVVTDDENKPMPGVNVVVKGTTDGTTTDIEGRYSLSVADGNAVLIFSFIGYQTTEITVGNQSVINVALKADISTLSEIVVVGYGTQKKASVTGAISSVAAEELSVQPVVNVGQALQGRVAGVSVTNNGAPGEAPIIRIRGVGTINNANPLFVVDGFPTSDLNSFNPKDIESVDVLKDASAAAIYGSRASNGVVLITTKSGKNNQKLSVNIDSYTGVEQPWRKLDLLNTEQYVDYATDLMTNADIYFNENNDPATSNVPDRVVGVSVPDRIELGGMNQPIHSQTSQTFNQTNTNWQNEMFRTGRIQQHKIDLSGGSAISKVYASVGYFDQEGIMLGTGYKRWDARFNSDHNVTKRVTIGQNFYVAFDERKIEQQSGGRTQLQHIIRSSPYFPVYNPDNKGGFFGAQTNNIDGTDPENPVRIASMDKQNQQRLKFLGNVYADVKIFDFLSYRIKVGVDYVDYTQKSHSPSYNTGAAGFSSRPSAIINQNWQNFSSVLLSNQLTFNKNFGKHSVNATVVAEKQTNTFSQITGNGENGNSDIIEQFVGLTGGISLSGGASESALISYIGRVNYEFNERYLVGASFRRDGSSRFSPDNRWGNFPAVSVGWRISEEAFMANSALVSDMKLRASYGVTGNNSSPDYGAISTITGNQIYQIGGANVTGYTIRGLANQDIHWESTHMANIGLDMGVLNNQLTLSVEYFNNITKDMIISIPVPSSFGYDGNPFGNVGEVQNKGFELELGYSKSQGDFNFNASGNISFVRNEVLSLGDEGTTIAQGDWYGDNLTLTKVGQPIGYFNGYVMDGLFQEGESTAMQPKARPGDIRFKDVNGDGVLNSDDKVNVGHFLPDFSYGINLSANWKGFDASLFLQGVSGNQIYSVVKYDLEGMTRLFNSGTAVLNRWTPENTNTNVPRAISEDPNQNARASDRFAENGSYFRVKNLTLGYNLASVGTLTKNALTRLRVYTTMQNLLTFTKYKSGYDPEVGNRNAGGNGLTQGVDYGQFPQARSIVVGLQVGF